MPILEAVTVEETRVPVTFSVVCPMSMIGLMAATIGMIVSGIPRVDSRTVVPTIAAPLRLLLPL